MILLSMVQKELKQFFRDKGGVIMMFVFPVALIACLSFSLKSFMGGNIDVFSDKKVLYTIEKNSNYEEGFNKFREEFQKGTTLKFEEISNKEDAITSVDKYDAIALVTINENGYEYYRSIDGEKTSSKVFRSVLEQTLTKYALVDTVIKENPRMIEEILKSEELKYVKETSIGGNVVTSFEYYTFAELALIILYISLMTSQTVYNEGRLKTIDRVRLSKATDLQLILSKAIFGVIIGMLQITIVYLFSTLILKVNWGENLPLMVCVLLALTVLASVLGIIVGLSLKDDKSIQSTLTVTIVSLCLTGGSYAPLSMLKGIPVFGELIKVSPIYWVNSALTSLNTGVVNNYAITSIGISLGLSGVLILAYIIIRKVKGGIRIA
ncbi:MAG: ABC transporter permease [Clostridium sp.]